jgi:hypothetical protein
LYHKIEIFAKIAKNELAVYVLFSPLKQENLFPASKLHPTKITLHREQEKRTNMAKLRWGILGAGKFGGTFARGIQSSKTGELVAIGSRTQEK